jgi:hypothetical protein
MLIIKWGKYHDLLSPVLTGTTVHDPASDRNPEPRPEASCTACRAFHGQHLAGLAVCELNVSSTFEQMPGFPGVELACKSREGRSGRRDRPFRKDDLCSAAKNSPI